MFRRSIGFGAAAIAVAALAGCQQIGEWTGKYVPRQPEIAGSARTSAAAVASLPATTAASELEARLSGTSEIPINFSEATGRALVSYDRTSGLLSWVVDYDRLSSEATGAHFHGPAAEGENAGVQVNIGGAGLASPIVGSATITPEQAAALLGGLWYVNIHSTNYPDGEIRGQLKPSM